MTPMQSGRFPYPPMNDTMNMVLREVQEGRVVFQGIPQARHDTPLGPIHGRWFVNRLDSAAWLRDPDDAAISAHLHHCRPEYPNRPAATHQTGPLRVTSEVTHRGRQLAAATSKVNGESGRLYASAARWIVLVRATTARRGRKGPMDG